MEEVILPIRVAKFLGCHTAILTNAAGGINHDFHLGDLMLITGVVVLAPVLACRLAAVWREEDWVPQVYMAGPLRVCS